MQIGFHAIHSFGEGGPSDALFEGRISHKPFLVDILGEPPRDGSVDDGGSADSATLDERDGEVAHREGCADVAVKLGVGGPCVRREVLGEPESAFFDQDDAQPRCCEVSCDGCTSRPAANHHSIGLFGVRFFEEATVKEVY